VTQSHDAEIAALTEPCQRTFTDKGAEVQRLGVHFMALMAVWDALRAKSDIGDGANLDKLETVAEAVKRVLGRAAVQMTTVEAWRAWISALGGDASRERWGDVLEPWALWTGLAPPGDQVRRTTVQRK
jgi:hypothetical protein